MRRIDLDHNATTPLDPRVREQMIAFLSCSVGNPSSLHGEGRAARRVLEEARETVARALEVEPDEIVFTSGATEANNLALRGILDSGRSPHRRTALSAIEHPSVLEALDQDTESHHIAVDPQGRVDPEDLRSALARGFGLVSIMAANNEIGTLQDLPGLARLCHDAGAVLHSDAVQILGKLPFSLRASGVRAASFSGHKIGGPMGCGVLWVDRETGIAPRLRGGNQERGRRAGTENLVGIVGFSEACRLATLEAEARSEALRAGEVALLEALKEEGVAFELNGPDSALRLPGTLNLHFPGQGGEALLLALDLEGVAVSQGSACTSGAVQPSNVLKSLHIGTIRNLESLRLSLSWTQSREELREAARRISRCTRP